jgi:hypothetical protein
MHMFQYKYTASVVVDETNNRDQYGATYLTEIGELMMQELRKHLRFYALVKPPEPGSNNRLYDD